MARVWLGDFRIKAIQKAGIELESTSDDKYFFEDSSEYYWFSTVAINQFVAELTDKSSVILMLGFNDCVNSCLWQNFDIKEIASNYVTTVNDLIGKLPSIKFYFCSINPISSGYPAANYADGVVSKEALMTKIEQFNEVIKQNCSAKYIDCYAYLASTSFTAYDGIRFSLDTAKSILTYIAALTESTGAGLTFAPRLTDDDAPIGGEYSDDLEFWRGDSYDGLNPFDGLSGHTYEKYTGDTLPNCTAYAWGRFYEILGSKPALSTYNAEYWYLKDGKHDYGDDGYKRGSTPACGAVICWQKGDIGGEDAGHVAIVEQVNSDGTIITSESGWNDSRYWWTTKRDANGYYTKDGTYKATGENSWGQASPFKFQGFIYCPGVSGNSVVSYVAKSQVIAENRYLSRSEQEINARYIWQYLGSRGWTLNAVAGMLGNMESESGISPCRYEIKKGISIGKTPTRDEVAKYFEEYKASNNYYKNKKPPRNVPDASGSYGRYPGCGLTGWTFSDASTQEEVLEDRLHWNHNKLIKWCDERNLDFQDMDGNLERIIWEKDHGKQWVLGGSNYKISFKDFSTSRKSAYWLAGAFLDNYENPANPDFDLRGKRAEAWYKFLLPYAPGFVVDFAVTGFKIDKCSTSTVSASFIVSAGKSGWYEIRDIAGDIINGGNLNDKIVSELDEPHVVTFDSKGLTPNKKYKLVISVTSKYDDEYMIEETIAFTTPQAYPESIDNIELIAKDAVLPHDSFQIEVNKPHLDWGYWKSNGHGYVIQLIINGDVKSEKTVNSLQTNFTISDYFDYKVKLGDVAQIGIRTWVKDDDGKKIFDSNFAKASNPICMLKKPVVAYINNG